MFGLGSINGNRHVDIDKSVTEQTIDPRYHEDTSVLPAKKVELDLHVHIFNKDWVCVVVDPSNYIEYERVRRCKADLEDRDGKNHTKATLWRWSGTMTDSLLDTQYRYFPMFMQKMREANHWLINAEHPTIYWCLPYTGGNRTFDLEAELGLGAGRGADNPDTYFSPSSSEYAYYCFMKMPTTMTNGTTYDILDAFGNHATFTYNEDTSHSWAMKVNQLGYLPNENKLAYLGAWVGQASVSTNEGVDFSSWNGSRFDLKRVSDDASVYNSTIGYVADDRIRVNTNGDLYTTNTGDINTSTEYITGEYKQYNMDFSAYTTAGEYYLQIDGIGKSWPFEIASDIYGELFYHHARCFTHQRGTFNLTSTYTYCPSDSREYNWYPDKLTEYYTEDIGIFKSNNPSGGGFEWDDKTDFNFNWGWSLIDSSSSTVSIGTGSKSLTVGTGQDYVVDADPDDSTHLTILYDEDNWMYGNVTAYNNETGALTINIDNSTGSGSYSTWDVNQWIVQWEIDGFDNGHDQQMNAIECSLTGQDAEDDVIHTGYTTSGWHDAADKDRGPDHIICSDLMATAYLANPTWFTDSQLNIPESGNGIPDILSEASIGVDWIVATQAGNGGVVISAEQSNDRRSTWDQNSIDDTKHVEGLIGSAHSKASTDTETISTGVKTMTVATGKAFTVGDEAVIIYDEDNWMSGEVDSYDGGSGAIQIDVDTIEGSGEYSSWGVAQSPAEGVYQGYKFFTGQPTRIGSFQFSACCAILGKAYLEAGKTTEGNAYIASAEDAFDFAENTTQLEFTGFKWNNRLVKWVGPSDTTNIYKKNRFWATAMLRIATEDSSYLTILNAIGTTEAESYMNDIYVTCQNSSMANPFVTRLFLVNKYSSLMPSGWGTYALGRLTATADVWESNCDWNFYRDPWKKEGQFWNGSSWESYNNQSGSWKDVNWNWRTSGVMAILLLAHKATGTQKYLDAGLDGMNYYLGCNPHGRTRYSGIGSSSVYHWLLKPDRPDWGKGEWYKGAEIYNNNMYPSSHTKGSNQRPWQGYSVYGREAWKEMPVPYENDDEIDVQKAFGDILPAKRCMYSDEGNEVPMCEFTVHETYAPAVLASALLMGTGWTPSQALKDEVARTDAEMVDSKFYQI